MENKKQIFGIKCINSTFSCGEWDSDSWMLPNHLYENEEDAIKNCPKEESGLSFRREYKVIPLEVK